MRSNPVLLSLMCLAPASFALGCGSDDNTAATTDGGTDTRVATDSVTPTDSSTPTDSASSDTTAADTATTDTKPFETGAFTCPFTGAYEISTYACDTTDITATWKGIVPNTEVTFSNIVAGGGGPPSGCHVVVRNKNATCDETEEMNITFVSGTSYNKHPFGVTKCAPAACTFTTGDAPCAIGDRAGADSFIDVTKSGVTLTFTTPAETTGICAGKKTIITLDPPGV